MTTAPSDKKPGTCPTCGAENPPGSRFCERCGTRLPPSSREAAGPTPATPADATLTFERPLAGFPREESPALGTTDNRPADTERAEETPVAPTPSPDRHDERASLRDAPTMNFDLPTLPTPEQRQARDAATLSFDLPEWAQYEKAHNTPTTAEAPATPAEREASTPAPASATPETASAEAEKSENRSWDYRPWTPQDPAELTAEPPVAEQGGTRPAIALPPSAPAASGSQGTSEAGASSSPSPTPYPIGIQPPPSTAGQFSGVGGDRTEGPSTPGAYTYPTPGPPASPTGQLPPPASAVTPPPYGYPQGGATAWGPPGATAYPAPATGNNNRTLWIILGVVGGLLILCAMICVLVFLVGVASASSTGAVATGVATTTRP